MLQMAKHQKLVDQLTNSTQKNIVKEKKMNCNWNSLMRETLPRIFNFLLRAYSSTGKFIYLGYGAGKNVVVVTLKAHFQVWDNFL